MKTLLIDNYDSFTFNLFQLIAEVNRVPPIVVRNDSASWDEIQDLEYDNIVISPGPGRPEVRRDFGISGRAILESNVPVLGICLGHQGIVHVFGGKVDYADEVMHGRGSQIHHHASDLFAGIPSPYTAIRYHSLLAVQLPDVLEQTAWTEDGIVMGVQHTERPVWGVQFHPESICTEHGRQLLRNFRSLTTEFLKTHPPRRRASDGVRPKRDPESYDVVPKPTVANRKEEPSLHGEAFKVLFRRIPKKIDAELAFVNLYSDSCPSFWLDSALVRGFSRFSYMGDATGPHAEFVSYDLADESVTVRYRGESKRVSESIFSYLDKKLRDRRTLTEGLPFDFNCGYAGYFGYELKADSCGDNAHSSPTADAAFVFADRIIAFDHEENIAYLVCIDDEEHLDRAQQWLEETSSRLMNLERVEPWKRAEHPKEVIQELRHDHDEYLQLIGECQTQINRGETYEVCLTNMLTQRVDIDPLNTYRALREMNPAPYATFLRFPETAVLSSSPERFLTIDASGVVEAKPIKGTRPRGNTLEEDEKLYEDLRTNEKDRSENLMIVDLLRNDIGTVSEPGSVHVPSIFAVESYATVHQLVSTIRGRLRPGISAVECIREAFPGGSMTGAPKKRTMEIIDRLEAGSRGIYSGSIGFLGLNGSADLSIVIRTIVIGPDGVTIGAGGAIVALSDPQSELDEMILKSKALVHVLSESALSADEISKAG